MSAPSPLCLSATFNTRAWLSRRKSSGVEVDNHMLVGHLQKNYPTLKPREVEYVLDNAKSVQSRTDFLAFW